ncbi:MAG TPA: hypothetical protein PLK58_11620 [Candidatus Rifleibacterium sp.]|jgi:hypothetical protein|nr:hypothetical protein [Candidatus Rifleibacterium sp.]HPW59284.1 hypothetical protein [Candidatus Rifleibacterium sp.]
MQIDKDQIVKSLLKKGFAEETCKHHRQFFHIFEGRETGVRTYISHTPSLKVYGDSLLAKMKHQLRLNSKEDLGDFLNCPMSREQYVEKLISYGVIRGE